MNRHAINKIKVVELRHLLDEVGDDPVLGPQFREQLDEAEAELRKYPEPDQEAEPLPRAAMFLRRGGVQEDTHGVRPSLAAEVLTQYERMFAEQAIHIERDAAREAGRVRRPKGSVRPGLWFTGTPHGSFGLEFVPQTPEDPTAREVYRAALTIVTDALVGIASADDESADRALSSVASTVLKPMRLFLRSLASHGAELRVAISGQRSRSLSVEQLVKAAEQLDREVTQEEKVFDGRFRGVTLESGHFDFVTDNDDLITGDISEEVPPEFVESILKRTNQPARAMIVVTTVRPVTGPERVAYLLIKAEDHPNHPPDQKAN